MGLQFSRNTRLFIAKTRKVPWKPGWLVTPKGLLLATGYKADERISVSSSSEGFNFNLSRLIITLDSHATAIFKSGMSEFVAHNQVHPAHPGANSTKLSEHSWLSVWRKDEGLWTRRVSRSSVHECGHCSVSCKFRPTGIAAWASCLLFLDRQASFISRFSALCWHWLGPVGWNSACFGEGQRCQFVLGEGGGDLMVTCADLAIIAD